MTTPTQAAEQKSHSWILYFYILAGILTIYARTQNPFGEPSLLEMVSKTLLMPLLALWFVVDYGKLTAFARTILAALFFSWGGDVFLMFTTGNELFFMAGLGSFLIAHLFYIKAFVSHPKGSGKGALQKRPVIGLPMLFYMAALMWLLAPRLADMAIPVWVYAAVICLMALAAMNRGGRTNKLSYGFVLAGALIFVLSDSMIALNKFYSPFEAAGALIMLTYTVAQYCIVIGALYQDNPPPASADS